MPTVAKQAPKPQTKAPTKAPTTTGIASRIVLLEDLPDDGIKMCVYGKSGTGKTRFMSTFAKLGPLLHMICSSNGVNEARSIKGTPNIECIEIEKPDDLSELVEYAKSGKFKTVCLDHVTGFADLLLAEIVGLEKMPEQNSWGTASMKQYGQLGLQGKTYLRELLDLSCNVIITGQERTFDFAEGESEDILMPYVSVAATPAIAGWIAPAVDYMCQTFKRAGTKTVTKKMGEREFTTTEPTGKKEFCLRVGPDQTYITKFRVPPGTELPDVVVDPTYEKIAHLVNVKEG